jgi:hypothetical protein
MKSHTIIIQDSMKKEDVFEKNNIDFVFEFLFSKMGKNTR